MQAIAAAAGGRVVERLPQVALPQEPAEGAARMLEPARLTGHSVRFETSRNHGARFHGLLVEGSRRRTAPVETVRADGGEVPVLR